MNSWYNDDEGGGGGGLVSFGESFLAPFTKPNDAQFSWSHQGASGNVDATGDNNTIYLFDEGGQGTSYLIQGRVVPVPTGNYSVELGYIPQFCGHTGPSDSIVGMMLYQSGVGSIQTFDFHRNSSGPIYYYQVNRWSAYNTYSSTAHQTQLFHNGAVKWMKIVNDGTNMIYLTSADGKRYVEFFRETIAGLFLIPTHIGFQINNYGGTVLGSDNTQNELGMRVVHWKIS